MQNEDKNEVAAAAPVPEVMPALVASEGAPAAEKKLSKWREWWQQRSAFEKEFSSFVALPTILTFGYFALIASPMYVSETQFAVKDVVEQGAGIDIASQIFKTSSSSVQNARIVEAYLRSPDLFNALDRELKVVDYYSSGSHDWISRLAKNPTAWDKETFWSKVSQPKLDVLRSSDGAEYCTGYAKSERSACQRDERTLSQ